MTTDRILPDHRIDGVTFAVTLSKLALVNALSGSLKIDLEPLDPEDVAAGAEPLSLEQIQIELEKICQTVTEIAVVHLGASTAEWYAANDSVE